MSDKVKKKAGPPRCKRCMGQRHPKKPCCDLDVQETITDADGNEREILRRRGMKKPQVVA